MASVAGQITQMLAELRAGDRSAESRLAPLVYAELRKIAMRHMRNERKGHTLQPTALVHEAFMKLVGQEKEWHNRSEFYAVASSVMRHILVDYARKHRAQKRGGGIDGPPIGDSPVPPPGGSSMEELLALDEALSRLSQIDERHSRVVEMRFFGGMTDAEIAGILGLSVRTVKRDWHMARAWLHSQLTR